MSSGTRVRETIELLCSILKENGLSLLEAETLRKAKFDKSDVCGTLWKLLFELIFFSQYGHAGPAMSAAYTAMQPDDQVKYVKKEMQKRGYMARIFAALPNDMSHGSRELLLAFAWLLNKESIIQKFMVNRSSPVSDDLLSSYKTEDANSTLMLPTFNYKQQQNPEHRIQQILVLNSKLKMSLRLLYAAQQEYATLTHRIHNSTYGVTLSPDMNHLTTVQVNMLRYPDQLKKVLSLLEEDSARLENLLKWEDKETEFWEWMESVLDLKLQQRTSSSLSYERQDDPQEACANQTILMDFPPSLASDIEECRRNLMSMILRYESDIERLEDLWAAKKSTVSKLELDRLLASINAEITELQSRISQGPENSTTPSLPPQKPPRLLLVKEKPCGRNAAGRLSSPQAASEVGSTEGSSKEGNSSTIQEAISRLQQQADLLESELKDMRKECLMRLNKIVAEVPSTICILPPHLRKMLQL